MQVLQRNIRYINYKRAYSNKFFHPDSSPNSSLRFLLFSQAVMALSKDWILWLDLTDTTDIQLLRAVAPS